MKGGRYVPTCRHDIEGGFLLTALPSFKMRRISASSKKADLLKGMLGTLRALHALHALQALHVLRLCACLWELAALSAAGPARPAAAACGCASALPARPPPVHNCAVSAQPSVSAPLLFDAAPSMLCLGCCALMLDPCCSDAAPPL